MTTTVTTTVTRAREKREITQEEKKQKKNFLFSPLFPFVIGVVAFFHFGDAEVGEQQDGAETRREKRKKRKEVASSVVLYRLHFFFLFAFLGEEAFTTRLIDSVVSCACNEIVASAEMRVMRFSRSVSSESEKQAGEVGGSMRKQERAAAEAAEAFFFNC